MIKLSNDQITRITEEVFSGMSCYVHKETGKCLIMVSDEYRSDYEELYRDEIKEIEENEDKYVYIYSMSSRESFRVMSSFLDKVKNRRKKEKLAEILKRRSPFRNFKDEVEWDEKYRQAWFDHRDRKYNEHTRGYLEEFFELEPLPEETLPENEINFEGKTFLLVQNSNEGSSTIDTIFEYEQDGDLITAEYKGGSIKFGNIIGKVINQQLHLVYQCLTNDDELKSGQAIADISFTPDGNMQLQMNWQWLVPGKEEGTSQYIEK